MKENHATTVVCKQTNLLCKMEQGLHLQAMSSSDLKAFLYRSLDTPLLHILSCHLLQPLYRTALCREHVLVTQRIYSRLHSFTQHFVFTAFDVHRFTTLARKHEGTTRESRDATNTIAGYPRGTITSQVCSVSYLVYPSGCNGL